MSPILVRPVREQLEHDRVIRLLQQDLSKRKVEVGINPGAEQNTSVAAGGRKEYPDAVLFSLDKGRKLIGVLEVETGESVNNLEAIAQWAHLARLKVPFHLYVPMSAVDVARRLSADHHIAVSEIWSYHQIGEQLRFALAHRGPNAGSTLMSKVRPSPSISARPRPVPMPPPAEIEQAPAAKPAVAAKNTALAARITGAGKTSPSRAVPVAPPPAAAAKPPTAIKASAASKGKPSALPRPADAVARRDKPSAASSGRPASGQPAPGSGRTSAERTPAVKAAATRPPLAKPHPAPKPGPVISVAADKPATKTPPVRQHSSTPLKIVKGHKPAVKAARPPNGKSTPPVKTTAKVVSKATRKAAPARKVASKKTVRRTR